MDYGLILNITNSIIALTILIIVVVGKINENKKYVELNRKIYGLENQAEYIDKSIYKIGQTVSLEIGHNRMESSNSINNLSDSLTARINEMTKLQQMQSDSIDKRMAVLTESNEKRLESIRSSVEEKLKEIRNDNNEKLEAMRTTVEEKLHDTLEKRLGESFKIVSDRLEQVHKGLGEMQTLASGVGDLKKVLANVKTRGIWGEIQLGNILEQILAPEQYAVNIPTKENSKENVEYAIRLPGKGGNGEEILLPIDAKFPLEGFQKLIDASEQGDAPSLEEASKQLENSIKTEAKRISFKYINPPCTTDFAIMFLPVESLYAEVVKRPGLLEHLQERFRIIVTGPSTIVAFLNSLSMGFRTLAIEKRSGEIWNLLGVVKREFTSFGNLLDATNKKLQEASNVIDKATKKTRTIEKRLKDVEELPEGYDVAAAARDSSVL
ncbi:MAG: DNA recombination protein RmuC [Clostridiales bacterium]|nr:DNA recombination protein RmuC [Clostridiales bacterium]